MAGRAHLIHHARLDHVRWRAQRCGDQPGLCVNSQYSCTYCPAVQAVSAEVCRLALRVWVPTTADDAACKSGPSCIPVPLNRCFCAPAHHPVHSSAHTHSMQRNILQQSAVVCGRAGTSCAYRMQRAEQNTPQRPYGVICAPYSSYLS